MYQARDLNRITRDICEKIESDLQRAGIFYRIFSRPKSLNSITSKMGAKSYDGVRTFLQDVIGVRVNLYFVDDLNIVYHHLKSRFDFVSETIDINATTEFKPTRINLVFRIPSPMRREFSDVVVDSKIDNTFEVQLRTVLSEGWHEVDHDLRYKCEEDWIDHSDLSRLFNGILAALETSDWSILNLFEQISYRHYKGKNWSAMLRTKLRIRTNDKLISPDILDVINEDSSLQKSLFKLERNDLIKGLLEKNYSFPLSVDNLILLINHLDIENSMLKRLTSDEFIDQLK